jgi:hypothetical protein
VHGKTQLVVHLRTLKIGNGEARRAAFESDDFQTRARELPGEYRADHPDAEQHRIHFSATRSHIYLPFGASGACVTG